MSYNGKFDPFSQKLSGVIGFSYRGAVFHSLGLSSGFLMNFGEIVFCLVVSVVESPPRIRDGLLLSDLGES